MNKDDILKQLEEFKNSEDVLSTQKEARELIQVYNSIRRKEEEELKEKEADLDAEIEYDSEEIELNKKVDEVISEYREQIKEAKAKKKEEELRNLKAKEDIISEFKELVEKEENIGKLFTGVKAIRERWNEIGPIPRDKNQEIQAEFARLNEEFNYNVNIYKELKEHDLKKNYSVKNQLIHRAKELLGEEKIKTIETKLKEIQNEWTSVGPTFNEHWEELKKEYWDTVHQLYDKIKTYYQGVKEQQTENLKIKENLIEQANEIVAKVNQINAAAEWEKLTDELKKINEKWRATGRVAKEYNDKIWSEFRAVVDKFYEAKAEFYKSQNEVFKEKAKLKEALIEQAAKITEGDDWKRITNELKKLQDKWKEIGHAGKFQEQKLWKKFRKNFDDFFERKEKYFAELDKANKENLKKKEALVQEIEAYKIKEDKESSLADLKEFSKRFNAIGNVPFKEKDKIYYAYKQALDKHYSELNVSKADLAKMQFEAKLEQLKEAGKDVSELLKEERIKIRKKIGDLNAEIAKIENNFGFFTISKGAEKLLGNFKNEIDKKKAQIEQLKNELKQLNK